MVGFGTPLAIEDPNRIQPGAFRYSIAAAACYSRDVRTVAETVIAVLTVSHEIREKSISSTEVGMAKGEARVDNEYIDPDSCPIVNVGLVVKLDPSVQPIKAPRRRRVLNIRWLWQSRLLNPRYGHMLADPPRNALGGRQPETVKLNACL